MEKVEKLNKVLYKIELYLLKVIPMIIAVLYFSNTVLSLLGYDYIIFSILGGMSILPLIFLYISSYVFKYCEYHRMFLHYVVLNDIITWIDYKYPINIDTKYFIVCHIIIFCIFLFIILYLKLNHETKLNKTNIKRP